MQPATNPVIILSQQIHSEELPIVRLLVLDNMPYGIKAVVPSVHHLIRAMAHMHFKQSLSIRFCSANTRVMRVNIFIGMEFVWTPVHLH